MSLFKLAWLTSCLSFLLALSQSLLESSVAAMSPSESSRIQSTQGDGVISRRGSSPDLAPLAASWLLPAPEASAQMIEPPLQISLTDRDRPASLATSHLSSLSAQAAAWQASLGNAFCRSTPPALVNWSTAPSVPAALATPAQAPFAKLSLTQRFAQAIESLFHWSELSPTDGDRYEVQVTTSPLGLDSMSDTTSLSFWTVLRQPNQLFRTLPPAIGDEFYVKVNHQIVGRLESEHQAQLMAERLGALLRDRHFDPQELQPSLVGGQPAGRAGPQVLFVLDESVASSREQNRELMAIKWVNNLRLAFALEPLDLVTAQQEMYGITETAAGFHGLASWYGPYFHGRQTANGETYDQEAFTAAHPSLPFNTYLKVTNLETQEAVIVRINDRGPYIPPRTLDLSQGAARCLNSKEAGVVPYHAAIMEPHTAAAKRPENSL